MKSFKEFLNAYKFTAKTWLNVIIIFTLIISPTVSIVYGWGVLSIGSTPAFQCDAVVFDGTNDWMNRGADLTGNADSKVGTISFWFKFNGNDNAVQWVFENSGDIVYFSRLATNKFKIAMEDGAAGVALLINSNTAYTADATWHHIALAYNLATPVAHLYIDGVNDEAAGATEADKTIDYTRVDHSVGAKTGGATPLHADLAELYINYAEFLDISVAANLQKLRSSTGKPVDLGADGSTPTGTQPIVYFSVRPGDAATVFATNKGSGGNFTITGALAIAATSPSD